MIIDAIGMVLFSRHSDRTGERKFHVAAALLMLALGIAGGALLDNSVIRLLCFTLANIGSASLGPMLYPIPTSFLSKGMVAAGIAVISSLGALGALTVIWEYGEYRIHQHEMSLLGDTTRINMQWSVDASDNPRDEIAAANFPNVRLFLVPLVSSPVKNADVTLSARRATFIASNGGDATSGNAGDGGEIKRVNVTVSEYEPSLELVDDM